MNSFKGILEDNKFRLSFVDKEKQYRIYLRGKIMLINFHGGFIKIKVCI